MKKVTTVVIALLMSSMFLGCNDDEVSSSVADKLVVSKSITNLELSDQHGKKHTIAASTEKLIFAFSKDVAHHCNDFLVTQKEDYLATHNAVFIADVSAAPSLIRSMFIMPGLKDFKHQVLIFEDEARAKSYSAGMDKEKIIVATLKNGVITAVENLNDVNELQKNIE